MYKQLLIFGGGVLVGAAATYFFIDNRAKKKYEKIAQEEIVDVKNLYLSKCRKIDEVNKLQIEKDKVGKIIFNEGYSKDKEIEDTVEDEDEDEEEDEEEKWERESLHPVDDISEVPYTITPTQFVNEKRYYDKITLLYYENDVLTSEAEDYYEDIESTIGRDSLNKFDEYEEDVVYVRNDRLSTDYEVLRQHCTFDEDLN